MLTHAVIRALLEDGPHETNELAAWLDLPVEELGITLDAMGFKPCERCRRRFIRPMNASGRFCSRACYRVPPEPIARPMAAAPVNAKEARPFREDDEFVSIWNGRDPLPGREVGLPGGLGSSLSGGTFMLRTGTRR